MIARHLPVLVPLLYLVAALAAALVGARRGRLAHAIALVAAVGAAGLAAYGLLRVVTTGTIRYQMGGWMPPIGIEYVLDPLSSFFTLVVALVAALVIAASRASVRSELAGAEVPFWGMAMLLLAGFAGIVITGDLFNLYVFLEISSLAGYALVSVGDRKAPVAAFRYLIVGTIGASFFLLGLWFLYNLTGSLNMADIAAILPHVRGNPALVIAATLMVTGMGIKMALFPLHGWLPDAYTHAPSAASALIAPIGTKIGAYVLIRLLLFIFGSDPAGVSPVLLKGVLWLSAAGILYGSILAMAQRELKRMLAFSSVAQVGYIGLGVGLAHPLGLIGAVLHVVNHAFMKACLFMVAGAMRLKAGHSDIERMDASLSRGMPWTCLAFTVAALAMIGIPPTAGFFSKWYLARGAVAEGAWIMVAVIMVSSLLNAVYFFKVLERLYLKPAGAEAGQTPATEGTRFEAPLGMRLPTLALAAGIVLLGLFNVLIVNGVLTLMVPAGL